MSTEQDIFLAESKTKGIEKISMQIKKEHPTLNISLDEDMNFTLEPSVEEVRALFKFGTDFSSNVILSSQHPVSLGFHKNNFFTIINLRGDNFPFTLEQIEMKVDKSVALQERLGLSIRKTNKNFSNMAGAEALRVDVENMLNLEALGLMSISGLFLFGVAGAGKSYFAEVFAGETGRYFAILDLPHFMSLPSPTEAVDELFDFLESQDEKYLLLLDEIEKMFDFEGGNLIAKQVFGKLLSRLNDIYGNPKNNVTFLATANNITGILKNAPEFLRKGRFNRLYFLDYPNKKNTKEIFDLYKALNKKKLKKSLTNMYQEYMNMSEEEKGAKESIVKDLYIYFNSISDGEMTLEELEDFFTLDFNVTRNMKYMDAKYSGVKVSDDDLFIYSPPEIQAVSEEMQNMAFLKTLGKKIPSKEVKLNKGTKEFEESSDFTNEIISEVTPLQVAAAEGIKKQIAQATSYVGKDVGKMETFKKG